MANRVVDVMTIDGGDELRRIFRELPPRVATNVARRVLYAAAIPIRDAARQKAPVRFGALKKAIVVRTGQELVDAGGGRKVRGGNLKVYVTIDPQAKIILGVRRDRKTGKWSLAARRKSKRDIVGAGGYIMPRLYAHLAEFGTAPHQVGKGSKRKADTAIDAQGNKVNLANNQLGARHPGASPKPFMRPAFDARAADAVAIMQQKAGELIAEESAKLARAHSRRSRP